MVRAFGHESRRQRVEHQRQHTARKPDGEQTDIGQHVAQQSREVVVKVPQTRAEVDERIALRIVQKQHQHAADAQRRIEGHRSGRKARNGETRHRKAHGQDSTRRG